MTRFLHPSSLLLHGRGGVKEEVFIEDEVPADDEEDVTTVGVVSEQDLGVVVDVVFFISLCFAPL